MFATELIANDSHDSRDCRGRFRTMLGSCWNLGEESEGTILTLRREREEPKRERTRAARREEELTRRRRSGRREGEARIWVSVHQEEVGPVLVVVPRIDQFEDEGNLVHTRRELALVVRQGDGEGVRCIDEGILRELGESEEQTRGGRCWRRRFSNQCVNPMREEASTVRLRFYYAHT
jgi:hypothetical protein